MSQGVISVEVFRDVDTPDANIDGLFEGIARVQDIVPELHVAERGTPRKIRIAPAGAEMIKNEAIRWPRFSADINLVATTHPIWKELRAGTKEGNEPDELRRIIEGIEARFSPTLGVSHTYREIGGIAVAIIDTKKSRYVDHVASHVKSVT